MAYIKIENLTKSFKNNTVLKNINLSLEKGKIYGFVGRNGCGKTMLFRSISGLIKPTEGTIIIDSKQLWKDISFPPSVGIMIENIGLYNWFSGYENLKQLCSDKKITKEQICDAITRVGLDCKDKRPIIKYSLGMKQRIVIAQAIMEKPELLILDEPTNALDLSGVEEMRKVFLEEKERGATILIASHNQEDIKQLCDEIYYMDSGEIINVEKNEVE